MDKCELAGNIETCPAAIAGHAFPTANAPQEALECEQNCGGNCAYCLSDSDNELGAYIDSLNSAETFVELSNLQVSIAEAKSKNDTGLYDELEEKIENKIKDIMQTNREFIEDGFEGQILEFYEESDKKYKFRAITGQIDKPNKNKRIYTKEEITKNFPRAKRLMKSGGFTGMSGHPGFLSGDEPHKICVKFTDVEIDGSNVIQSGELVMTDVGKDIAALWDAGVALEWSWRGWGNMIPEDDEKYKDDPWGYKGNFIVTDYIWEGADIVVRGAARTKTIELTKDSLQISPPTEDEVTVEQIGDSANVTVTVHIEVDGEETETETTAPDSEEDEAQDSLEAIDVQITDVVTEEKMDMSEETTNVQSEEVVDTIADTVAPTTQAVDNDRLMELVRVETARQLEAQRLAAYKMEKIEAIKAIDSEFGAVLAKNISLAESVAEVDSIFSVVAPKLQAAKAGPDLPTGIAVINRQKTYEHSMVVGDDIVERPETVAGVKNLLLSGLEGGAPGTPKWQFEQIINNYETFENGRYLYACTRRGVMETATTTTALGTSTPQVLPLLRKLYPMLISYEIATVLPMSGPTSRVYTLDTVIAGTSTSLSASSTFDSTWADHTEGALKSQIAPKMSSQDITAVEKSIYFDLTSTIVQDMKALYNIDAEMELIREASNQIARELNYSFLELLRAGATASTQTYGTTKPTGYTSDMEWYRALSLYIAKVGGAISEKVYTPANYLVVAPQCAPLLSATHDYVKFEVPTSYGAGLRGTGTFASDYKVFVAEWFTANTMLVIAKGDTWLKSGAVFAPYIPLYISPNDYVPAYNTMSRAVSSRNGQVVLDGSFYGLINVDTSSGVPPF